MIDKKPSPVADPEVKAAMKQALREWLDDQFAMLGRWTAKGIAAAALAAVVYFILTSQGWHR
jgi:hypothetical protein